jgi:hypothetical protein
MMSPLLSECALLTFYRHCIYRRPAGCGEVLDFIEVATQEKPSEQI